MKKNKRKKKEDNCCGIRNEIEICTPNGWSYRVATDLSLEKCVYFFVALRRQIEKELADNKSKNKATLGVG